MEDEIKIVELELEGNPLKPSDLRMGGVIETKDGTMYMVLIIGGRFELSEKGEPVLWPEQYSAVVGEYVKGADEDHPIYGTFYNLKLADDSEEGFPLFSEKVGKFSANHSELPIGNPPERTELQHLLFGIHAHYEPDDPVGPGHIIYFETDLAKVCDIMHEKLQEEIGKKSNDPNKAKSSEWAELWHLIGMDQVFSEMKAFFEHKA